MGALTFLGGLAGLGNGISQGAQQWAMDNRAKEQQDAILQRERERQGEMTARNNDTLELRRELAAMKASGGAGSGGAGKVGANAMELLQDPGALAAMGGGTREEVAAFLDVARNGENQMVDAGTTLDDNEGEQKVQARKYQPGDGQKIMSRGYEILRRAMGTANPTAADDLAKADQTTYVTDAARRAEGGNAGAVRGALAAQGKAEFGESGTSHISGTPARGSVAESQIRENDAQAGNAKASAEQHSAKVQEIMAKIGLDKEDVGGKSKERLATMLNSLNAYVKDMDLSEADRKAVNDLRSEITRAMRSEVTSRQGALPGAAAAPAPAPSREPARSAGPASAASAVEMARSEAISSKQDVTATFNGRTVTFEAGTGKEKASKAAGGGQGGVAEPKSKAEYDALPSGALYRRDGKTYRKG